MNGPQVVRHDIVDPNARYRVVRRFYRQWEPELCAVAFAALVLVVWHAGVVLVRAVAGLL